MKLKGNVISLPSQKTVKVKTVTSRKHRIYNKRIFKIKNYLVHDEKMSSKIGDEVIFQETRPLSKLKRFRIIEILNSKQIKEN